MKKRILMALLVLACFLTCMLGLSSCGENTPGGKEDHTQHIDKDGDGMCDICGIKVSGGNTEHRHIDKDDNGKCDICDTELGGSILALVEYLTLDKETLTLDVGDTENLVVTVYPKSANGTGLTWNSSNDNVVTVKDGKVTAVAKGTATVYVTAKDENKQSASCVITVNTPVVPVEGITLDKTELTIEAGDIKTLNAEVLPANATNKKVNWSSSDESIVTVKDGKVTGVAIGEATVTATTADGNKTAECAVKVIKPVISVTKVTLDKTTLNLYPNETETLTATVLPADADNKSVLWSSSDGSVVSVANGNLTAKKAGKATITVTTMDGNYKATCEVTVGDFIYKKINNFDGEAIGYSVIGVGTVAGDRLLIPERHDHLPVIEIGKEAFKNCSKFSTVVIPDSVTTVGQDAFSGCTGIKNMTSPAFALSYVDRSKLSTVAITSGDKIEESAFSGSNNLTSITISDSITEIGLYAFKNCKYLSRVYITDLSKWCETSFLSYESNPLSQGAELYLDGELVRDAVIPEGVETIGVNTFAGYKYLKSVILPDSVTTLKGFAFQGCSELQRIKFGTGLKTIESDAFRLCSKLEVVEITDIAKWCAVDFGEYSANPLSFSKGFYLNGYPVYELILFDGVTEISARAFINCTSLKSVILPATLTKLSVTTFSGCSNIESVTIPAELISYFPQNKLTSVTISNGVTSIPENAFNNYSNLTSITLSMGVTSIGAEAFKNCSSLNSINIPRNVTSIGKDAFLGCSDLVNLTVSEGNTKYSSKNNCIIETESKTLVFGCKASVIPEDGSVTSIGDYAFRGCSGLTSVTIPEEVTSIGEYAFQLTGLENVVIPNSMGEVATNAFNSCYRISSVTLPVHCWKSIASYTIKTVVLTGGENIEDNLFTNYRDLSSVTLPDELKTIGASAFYGCSALTEITFPEELTAIQDTAFQNCSGLTSVVIPKSVTTIGLGVFAGCENLISITVNEENPAYSSEGNCIIEIESKTLIQGCKETVIPDDGSVASIDSLAFYDLSSLVSITIPKSITAIAKSAIAYCSNLTSVTILCSDTIISKEAFERCNNIQEVHINDLADWCSITFDITLAYQVNIYELTNPLAVAHQLFVNDNLIEDSLVIPEGVESIGKFAFDGLNSIRSVTIPDSVTKIGEGAFTSSDLLEEVHISDLSKWCAIEFGFVPSSLYDSQDEANKAANPLSKAHALYLNGEVIEDLVIPSDVTSVGNYVFYGGNTFKSITIHNNVSFVGTQAFTCPGATIYCEAKTKPANQYWYATWISSTYYSESNRYYRSIAVVWDCKNNQVDKLGYQYEFIDGIKYGLKNDEAIVPGQSIMISGDITIPETVSYNGKDYRVTFVSNYAFYNCNKLTSVTFPDSITDIGNNAFRNCSNLLSVTLSNNLTSLASSTFANCSSLTSIVIPSGVTQIYQSAFYNCSSLTSIIIPETLTKVSDNVFYYCDAISTVYYMGSSSSWSRISYSTSSDKSKLNSACYYFSETQPTEAGKYWHYENGVPTIWE